MSIVRIGLAESKNFSEGYDAIFGKKKEQGKEKKVESPAEASAAKKPKKNKKSKKK